MVELTREEVRRALTRFQPFDSMQSSLLDELAAVVDIVTHQPGSAVYEVGDKLPGLYLLHVGTVDILSPDDEPVSRVEDGDVFAERGLVKDEPAANRAVARVEVTALVIPGTTFRDLFQSDAAFRRFFDHHESQLLAQADPTPQETLLSVRVGDLMTAEPLTIAESCTVQEAALLMRDRDVSCVLVTRDDALTGILTSGDLGRRVVADGLSVKTPVVEVMTAAPLTLGSDALGYDALVAMTERGVVHLPVVDRGALSGIITASNLVRRQALSALYIIGDIEQHERFEDLATSVAKLPELLVQLVGSGASAHNVARIITSIADALTRRLVVLAQRQLGAAPVPWLWLACGSQGRMEQTGVSDQDNCLILDDGYDEAVHGPYFEKLAAFVSDGLAACGYYYCPGEMMATTLRWRQPLAVWRHYFRGWIAKPDPMAQMLASVMFDLRPIAGHDDLFAGLQRETLDAAKKNSIFRAHMAANSLKHQPPLGLFRGFALIRSGDHKDTVDLKHNGIVPIVDLARLYALEASIEEVGTRDRLMAAREAGVLSESGAEDLIDSFDLIATMRLRHQADLVRAGKKPDNFMAPDQLSALERNHLKDAFGVIKTLQSAIGHGRAVN
ncbi:MAG: putative nucleotidyltransferase substrate binding domain-containing protein [Pseudomonadota bacterium]